MSVTIVNGEAIDAAGALPGETGPGRGAFTARKTKNHLLRRARLGQHSPSGSGMAMSRQELAKAVNAHMYAASGRTGGLDANHVGKLERGEIRWPNAYYRLALCAVLGAARPADLGFYATRQGVEPEVSDVAPRSVTQLPARVDPAASSVAAAGVVNTTVRCTVEGTETGRVRIVVELGPGDTAVVVTSGSAAGLSALAEAWA